MKLAAIIILCVIIIFNMIGCSFTVIDDPLSSEENKTIENDTTNNDTPHTTQTSEINTSGNITAEVSPPETDETKTEKVEILYKADDIELTYLDFSKNFRTYEFDDCIIYGITTD